MVKKVYRTWEDWCLIKLREIGKSTIKQWITAMGGGNTCLNTVFKNNLDKLNITKSPTSNLKFYEVKDGVEL